MKISKKAREKHGAIGWRRSSKTHEPSPDYLTEMGRLIIKLGSSSARAIRFFRDFLEAAFYKRNKRLLRDKRYRLLPVKNGFK